VAGVGIDLELRMDSLRRSRLAFVNFLAVRDSIPAPRVQNSKGKQNGLAVERERQRQTEKDKTTVECCHRTALMLPKRRPTAAQSSAGQREKV